MSNARITQPTLPDPLHVRLSGAGGQGAVTAGIILAEAAMLDGRNVVQTQSYGPEARLGASKAEVIISSGKVAYPEVQVPDVLLCLSQDAFNRYASKVGEDTLIIINSTNVRLPNGAAGNAARTLAFPITETAIAAGGVVVVNVVALGLLNALLNIVSPQHLREAVLKRVPERYRELNERALEAGWQLASAATNSLMLDGQPVST
jgi:2-oxoglutarate ferredoxin oxidoreductase subunit gamma